MLNIALGEVVFGGVGVGIMGLLVFAILAVFIAGLMVGRTPEYLGKKIEGREMKLAMLASCTSASRRSGFAAIAAVVPAGKDAVLNDGPHGLSEILYATISQTGNNGSAFAGITVSGTFWAHRIGGLMHDLGPLLLHHPVSGARRLARRQEDRAASRSGTFPTTGAIFVVLLVGVILIVGALTYFPAFALGPDRRAVPHERRHSSSRGDAMTDEPHDEPHEHPDVRDGVDHPQPQGLHAAV